MTRNWPDLKYELFVKYYMFCKEKLSIDFNDKIVNSSLVGSSLWR